MHILYSTAAAGMHLFVDPSLDGWCPGDEIFVGEPEGDFLVRWLNSVGAVDDVAADLDAEISADGSWERVSWVGGTEHLAAGLDGVQTLPDHGDDWAGAHVLH